MVVISNVYLGSRGLQFSLRHRSVRAALIHLHLEGLKVVIENRKGEARVIKKMVMKMKIGQSMKNFTRKTPKIEK